ncbi:MAG: DJ-1/PfpI family protein [Clostridia bacterium]
MLIFEGCEPLDVFGPVEVFVAARYPHQEEPPHPFSVVTVAEEKDPLALRGGIRVVPDYTFHDSPPLNVLLVPGGPGTRIQYRNQALLCFIRAQAGHADIVASICTGAALVGAAGLLDGMAATTNRRSFSWVESVVPNAVWDPRARFVDNGRIVTSAGISAGIDMALHLVERLLGQEAAEAAAHRMEYTWVRGSAPPTA